MGGYAGQINFLKMIQFPREKRNTNILIGGDLGRGGVNLEILKWFFIKDFTCMLSGSYIF